MTPASLVSTNESTISTNISIIRVTGSKNSVSSKNIRFTTKLRLKSRGITRSKRYPQLY